MNLPKFVFEDVPLFLGLISDLFPALDCPRVLQKALKNAVVEELEKEGFHHNDEATFNLQVDKIIQLYETMLTRHTVMVVGPTGGGKTVVIQTLAKAQTKAFRLNTKLFTLNPKALHVSELYGVLNPVNRDWKDGLLSKLFRELSSPLKPDQNEARYIVFDGDVDALWVENMNSVMDDNKLLTLPNGERIRLEPHVKLMFEVGDLQYASPATGPLITRERSAMLSAADPCLSLHLLCCSGPLCSFVCCRPRAAVLLARVLSVSFGQSREREWSSLIKRIWASLRSIGVGFSSERVPT